MRTDNINEIKKNNIYADYTAGDAFIAGHMRDWVKGHKDQITKSQYAQLVHILELYSFDIYEEKQNSIEIAKRLNKLFKTINNKISKK